MIWLASARDMICWQNAMVTGGSELGLAGVAVGAEVDVADGVLSLPVLVVVLPPAAQAGRMARAAMSARVAGVGQRERNRENRCCWGERNESGDIFGSSSTLGNYADADAASVQLVCLSGAPSARQNPRKYPRDRPRNSLRKRADDMVECAGRQRRLGG